MKGQTIIELKDVKTGNIERHINKNMMTNALSEYFKTAGLMNNINLPRANLTENLLGGILLFDGAIEENASNIYPPANVHMVGNGAYGVTSNSGTTELGSYNSKESGWQDDGSFVQVYDFTTSQANGTIACVCLSSKTGAYAGYGNETSMTAKAKNSFDQYQGTNYDNSTYYTILNPVKCDYTNSFIDDIPTFTASSLKTSGKLTIRRRYLPLSKIKINSRDTNLVTEYIELTIPQDFIDFIDSSSTMYIFRDSDGNAFITQYKNFAPSSAIILLKINTQNQLSVISLINTTGISLATSDIAYVEKGFVILIKNKKVYRIKLEDSSSIEMFNYDNSWNSNVLSHRQNGRLFVRDGKIINVIEGTIVPFNSSSNYVSSNVEPMLETSHEFYITSQNTLAVLRSLQYIASINNLENPVEKTADKTMKVSYRITF